MEIYQNKTGNAGNITQGVSHDPGSCPKTYLKSLSRQLEEIETHLGQGALKKLELGAIYTSDTISFSPDGKRIAYASKHTHNENIYILDLASNKVKRVIYLYPEHFFPREHTSSSNSDNSIYISKIIWLSSSKIILQSNQRGYQSRHESCQHYNLSRKEKTAIYLLDLFPEKETDSFTLEKIALSNDLQYEIKRSFPVYRGEDFNYKAGEYTITYKVPDTLNLYLEQSSTKHPNLVAISVVPTQLGETLSTNCLWYTYDVEEKKWNNTPIWGNEDQPTGNFFHSKLGEIIDQGLRPGKMIPFVPYSKLFLDEMLNPYILVTQVAPYTVYKKSGNAWKPFIDLENTCIVAGHPPAAIKNLDDDALINMPEDEISSLNLSISGSKLYVSGFKKEQDNTLSKNIHLFEVELNAEDPRSAIKDITNKACMSKNFFAALTPPAVWTYNSPTPQLHATDPLHTRVVELINSRTKGSSYNYVASSNSKYALFSTDEGHSLNRFTVVELNPESPKAKDITIFPELDKIRPTRLSTKCITIKSQDGLDIVCYVQAPDQYDPQTTPFAVNLHGGPRGRDNYKESGTGLTISEIGEIRVNYRGSTGFGPEFIREGYGNWDKMARDVEDALQHLIDENIISENNLILTGHSFGAWLTYMLVARAKYNYKAALPSCGVGNTLSFLKDSYTERSGSTGGVENYMHKFPETAFDINKQVFGEKSFKQLRNLDALSPEDQAQLDKVNPASLLSKSTPKIPFIITHGDNDHNTPFHFASEMSSLLQELGFPVALIKLSNTGHSFTKHEDIDPQDAAIQAIQRKLIGDTFSIEYDPITTELDTASIEVIESNIDWIQP